MKSSGYDSFFKQARQNAGKTGANPKVRKKPVSTNTNNKKQLADYSENELRKMFKMQDSRPTKSKSKKRPSQEIPVLGGLIAFSFLALSSVVFLFPDEINDWVSGVDFKIMGQASAADQEKKSTKNNVTSAENSSDQNQVESGASAAKDSETIQDISYFSKLNERKNQLDLREKELEELERELNKQKVEIESRIQYLEKVRRDIAGVLKDRVEVDEEKVKKLVEFYSNMKPAQAAQIISTINEDLAIGVLSNMKKKNAAAILNMIEPKKAQRLSEKFAGYVKR